MQIHSHTVATSSTEIFYQNLIAILFSEYDMCLHELFEVPF